jgi:hypothetical protein
VPDARGIGDDPAARGIRLSLGGQVYDPAYPMGKNFFNILATFAEFEVDLLQMRTREGMAVAGPGQTPRPPTQALGQAAGRTAAHAPPATTPSPIWPNCSPCPGPPCTGPSSAAPPARHDNVLAERRSRQTSLTCPLGFGAWIRSPLTAGFVADIVEVADEHRGS